MAIVAFLAVTLRASLGTALVAPVRHPVARRLRRPGAAASRALSTRRPAFSGDDFAPAAPATITTEPVRAMVFIDGSWLYYSLHGRGKRCSIVERHGFAWQSRLSVDWCKVQKLIATHLHNELQLSQVAQNAARPVEITRSICFTSVRKDTPGQSLRRRMFYDMEDANYDVHMSVTTGPGEKCIDIALAVEMMHYAAVPRAYDVAVLVTGDKDFMPAMRRTRQQGKRLLLVSLHNSLNRDIIAPGAHTSDFNPLWLCEHMDEVLVPIPGAGERDDSLAATLVAHIEEMVAERGGAAVSSKEIGLMLQDTRIDGGDGNALQQLKAEYGSLRQLLSHFDQFGIEPGVASVFYVSIRSLSPEMVKLGTDHHAGDVEAFVDPSDALDPKVVKAAPPDRRLPPPGAGAQRAGAAAAVPGTESPLWALKKPELEDILRGLSLPVTGTKPALVERILGQERRPWPAAAAAAAAPRADDRRAWGGQDVRLDARDEEILSRVEGRILEEGLSGLGSREIGRALAAAGLLAPLKEKWGGLKRLLESQPARFGVTPNLEGGSLQREFRVTLASADGRPPPPPAAVALPLPMGVLEVKILACVEQLLLPTEGAGVSSRDVGRALQSAGLLAGLKTMWPSLKRLLEMHPDRFALESVDDSAQLGTEYRVRLAEGVAGDAVEAEDEDEADLAVPDDVFVFDADVADEADVEDVVDDDGQNDLASLTSRSLLDLSLLELKARARKEGEKVSGTKRDLIARLNIAKGLREIRRAEEEAGWFGGNTGR